MKKMCSAASDTLNATALTLNAGIVWINYQQKKTVMIFPNRAVDHSLRYTKILRGWKTYTRYQVHIIMKPTNSPTPRANPTWEKIGQKWQLGHFFFPHSKIIFRGLGLILYRKQTARNLTQSKFSANTLIAYAQGYLTMVSHHKILGACSDYSFFLLLAGRHCVPYPIRWLARPGREGRGVWESPWR